MDLSRGHGAPAVWLHTEGVVSVFPYAAPELSAGLSFSRCIPAAHVERGSHGCLLSSVQVKAQDSDNQLRLQASTQFFIHIRTEIAAFITACPFAEHSYVAGIVTDHLVNRVSVTG